MRIKPDKLEAIVARELAAYDQTVTDGVKKDVKQVAKECAAAVKRTSPHKSGRYRKGWTVKHVFESETDIRVRVCNKNAPQLTHLLEHGHAKTGGGRVEGKPHIGPAEAEAARKLGKRVKVRVGRA